MVENIILDLLRGSHEGNWNLHLNAIRYMIPLCFAYDKVNYARYLSAYYAEMTNLSEKKPDVYEAFQAGQFSVQISCNNPFGRIPVDQTTEVTVNKDTQTPGGTARFSLKPGAIKRYYLTAEYMLSYKKRELKRRKRQCHQGWINPFAEKQDLVHADIVSDLMKAEEIGEQCYSTFKDERLEKDPPAKKFHDTITTNKLIVQEERSEVRWENSHLESRQEDQQVFPGHNSSEECTSSPGNSASVVDGMNSVQRIKGDQATFGDVAVTVLLMALKEGGQSKRIDVVFDTYQENSIKNSERSVRGEETGHQLQSITGTQIVRQWRTFLSRIKN